jgi:hypothetical protein
MANYDAIVLDGWLIDIHDTLSLGILFEIQSGSFRLFKDLCLKRMSSVSRLGYSDFYRRLEFWDFNLTALY